MTLIFVRECILNSCKSIWLILHILVRCTKCTNGFIYLFYIENSKANKKKKKIFYNFKMF